MFRISALLFLFLLLPDRLAAESSVFAHRDVVSALAFTPDAQYLVSASWDGTVRVWSPAIRKELWRFVTWAFLTSLSVTSDGKHVVAGAFNGSVYMWSLQTGERIQLGEGCYSAGPLFSSKKHGQYRIRRGPDAQLYVERVRHSNEVNRLDSRIGEVRAVAISEDGTYVAIGDAFGFIQWWSTADTLAQSQPVVLNLDPPEPDRITRWVMNNIGEISVIGGVVMLIAEFVKN